MKALVFFVLSVSGGLAADRIVVFGDSFSKENEVEFVSVDASNWIEILDDHRHELSDIG